MAVIKSLVNGDVILKFRVPVAKSITLDYFYHEVRSNNKNVPEFEDFFSYMHDNRNVRHHQHTQNNFFHNLQQISMPFRDEANRLRSVESRIYRHTSENTKKLYHQFSEKPMDHVRKSLACHEVAGYHYFIIVLGSKLARSRGLYLPSFFEPFLSSLGINYNLHYTNDKLYKDDEFLYNVFFGNDDERFKTSYTPRSTGRPLLYGAPFANFNLIARHESPANIIKRQRNTLHALGLSMHMVSRELYEDVPMPDIIHEKLSQMPPAFNACFKVFQSVPINDDRHPNSFQELLKMLIYEKEPESFFVGNTRHDIPEKFHLLDDEERRKAFVSFHELFIYRNHHEGLSFVFRPWFRSQLVLHSLPLFPKKTLPSIELVET